MNKTIACAVPRPLVFALVLSAALCSARAASADTLTLMWDYNTEPEVTGYLVYVGTQSGVYSQTIDVHNTDTYVFANAQPGQRYYFAVAAYAGSLISPLSVEVSGVSNEFPLVTYPGDQTNRVGQSVSLVLSGSDPDGTALGWSATGLPPGLTMSSLGVVSGTPITTGTYAVTVTASDGVLAGQQSFTWTIQPEVTNTPPALGSPGSMSSTVGQVVVLQLQGSDPDGDALTYSASGLPAGLQLTASTGRISGTPSTAGSYTVNASVSDSRASANVSFGWTISASAPQNAAPTMNAVSNQSGTVGQATALQLQAVDSNGDALTYTATGLPPGLQITSSTGRIAGTPTTAGSYGVTARAGDGSLTAQRTFTWTIAAANVAPVMTAPGNQTGTVGQAAALQLQATDANGNTLTFSATGLPPGLQITASTGRIAGTPTTAGTYSVTATVSDGSLTAQRSFTWAIAAATTTAVAPETTTTTTTRAANRRTTSGGTTTGSATPKVRDSEPKGKKPRTTTSTATGSTAESGSTATTSSGSTTFTGTAAVRSIALSPEAYSGEAMTRPESYGSSPTGALSTTFDSNVRSVARTPESDGSATQALGSLALPASSPETDGDARTTVTAPSAAPVVKIETPVDRAVLAEGATVIFSATAFDVEDGDLTEGIVWSSSIEGHLGTGGLVTKVLKPGVHTISATVADSRGAMRTARITVIVK